MFNISFRYQMFNKLRIFSGKAAIHDTCASFTTSQFQSARGNFKYIRIINQPPINKYYVCSFISSLTWRLFSIHSCMENKLTLIFNYIQMLLLNLIRITCV